MRRDQKCGVGKGIGWVRASAINARFFVVQDAFVRVGVPSDGVGQVDDFADDQQGRRFQFGALDAFGQLAQGGQDGALIRRGAALNPGSGRSAGRPALISSSEIISMLINPI